MLSDNKDFRYKTYSTWIIAYCPSTNSFFTTNERAWYWEYDKEFKTEQEAISFFTGNLEIFWNEADKLYIEAYEEHLQYVSIETFNGKIYNIYKNKEGGYDLKLLDDNI